MVADCPCSATNSAPKPNTRFLQSILRETDSHNAALKKKEELEARLRLQAIRNGKTRGVEAEGRESKKRRGDFEEAGGMLDHKRRSRKPREEDDSRPGKRDRHGHRHSHRSMRDGTRSFDEYRTRKDIHRPLSHRDRDVKSRSSSPEEDRLHRRRRRSSSDSSNPDRHRSRRHKRERQSEHDETHRQKPSSSPSRPRYRTPPTTDGKIRPSQPKERAPKKRSLSPSPNPSSSSSDPLEEIVGPLPPSKTKTTKSNNQSPPLTSRGRNSYRPSSSKIDTHFSPTYDPTLDLQPRSSPFSPSGQEKEKEDWDLALEALRDREIWKKRGADRLREAGFGEGEVRRWEESATATGTEREKGVEDVKWKGKGEEREWDAGKVVLGDDDDAGRNLKGEVGLEAAWKRKGGGFLKEMKRALG